MEYYASIYALSMAVMLILKAVRGVVFVKVCTRACAPPLPSGHVVRLPPDSLGFIWNPGAPLKQDGPR